MSDALTRKVRVCELADGAPVPNDGRIYRDSKGVLHFGIQYRFQSIIERSRHFDRLAMIATHEPRRRK